MDYVWILSKNYTPKTDDKKTKTFRTQKTVQNNNNTKGVPCVGAGVDVVSASRKFLHTSKKSTVVKKHKTKLKSVTTNNIVYNRASKITERARKK